MRSLPCASLGCPCACHRVVRRKPPCVWTPEMDARLADGLAHGGTVGGMAARMHLTADSVRWRIRALGLSTRDGWRSRQEVAGVLGVSRRSVDRWVRQGSLPLFAHGTRWTRVNDVDLRAFVEEHAGLLFVVDGVTDPALRRLAQTSAIVNQRRAAP